MPSIKRIFACVLLALAALAATPALAQDYQPGQQIEYKAQNWPEKWEVGSIVRELPGGTQVLVREKPTQFFPEGFERAYALNDVRPVTQAQAPAAPAARPQPAAVVQRPAPPRAVAGQAGGGGCAGAPMSQQQVLGFLQQRLGDGDPFADNPKREAALAALRVEVLKCGVDFHNHAIGDFANQLGEYGALSNVSFALNDNFGPPAQRGELYGAWRIAKVGATTTVSRGGNLYQRQEYAGNAGSLTIDAGGTYTWNSPSGVFQGNWRAATVAEMTQSDKGGEGVVLLGAKSGADWLVHRRTEEGPEGTGIMIRDLATRNLRERAVR